MLNSQVVDAGWIATELYYCDSRCVPVSDSHSKILTAARPTVNPIDMMTYLNNFSPLTWSFFLFSTILIAILLNAYRSSSTGRRMLHTVWRLIAVTLRNGDYQSG